MELFFATIFPANPLSKIKSCAEMPKIQEPQGRLVTHRQNTDLDRKLWGTYSLQVQWLQRPKATKTRWLNSIDHFETFEGTNLLKNNSSGCWKILVDAMQDGLRQHPGSSNRTPFSSVRAGAVGKQLVQFFLKAGRPCVKKLHRFSRVWIYVNQQPCRNIM